MAGRGVHFSLDEAEVAALRGLDHDGRIARVFEDIEPDYFASHRDRLAESDKAWDAMHRALTNGLLEWVGGDYPLTHLVLGGELLEEDDVVMVLKVPEQVRDVAIALPSVTRESMRAGYDRIDAKDYEFELGTEDFEYVWNWFEAVRAFWLHAADETRYVLFTVDL